MKSKAPSATKAEKDRMARLQGMPCLACLIEAEGSCDFQCGPTEVHHLLSGNKRRGHAFTIPLGSWHHRGVPTEGDRVEEMMSYYGPSLALQSKMFRAIYGKDDELLERTNQLLGEIK